MQMYIVLPFLYVAFLRRSPWLLLALWAISVPIALIQGVTTARLNVIGFVPCFLSGVIAWRLEKTIPRRFPGALFPVAVAVVSVVWLIASRSHQMYYRWAFCLFLGLTLPQFRDLRPSLIVQMAKLTAKYSYGIYMFHIITLIISFHFIPEMTLLTRWFVFVLLTSTLPVLMFHFIEDPMIRMGQNAASRIATSCRRRDSEDDREVSLASVP